MASVSKRTWTHKGVEAEAWVVRYTDHGGKRRMRTFERKKDADHWRSKVELELNDGLHVARRASLTVTEALDAWLDNCDQRARVGDELRPRAVRSYRSWSENHIKPLIGDLLIGDLTIQRIRLWMDALRYHQAKPRGPETITHCLGCLRRALAFAYERGRVGRNILVDHKLRVSGAKANKIEIPTKELVANVLKQSGVRAQMGGVAHWLRPMLYTAVFSGLRQGEIRALQWGDIDFDAKVIRVQRSVDNLGLVDKPKSNAGVRDVPLAPALAVELKKWRLKKPGRDGADLVFVSRLGNPIMPANVRSAWLRLVHRVQHGGKGQTELKGEGLHFHALRHFFASMMIEANTPPKRLQVVMGHASISMTYDIYGHLLEDDGRIALAMEGMAGALVA